MTKGTVNLINIGTDILINLDIDLRQRKKT